MDWRRTNLLLAGVLYIGAGIGGAANVDSMAAACRGRATRHFQVPASAVTVKYEGRRRDKTHAVNGTAKVKGRERTFQCTFVPSGAKISRFVANPAPRPEARVAAPPAAEDDATRRVSEGKFNANGAIPCAQYAGQPMKQCKFGVSRGGNGTATVVLTRPDGRTRTIYFRNGKAMSADTSQADGYNVFRATKQADLFMIIIGTERYEIPEAVVFGG